MKTNLILLLSLISFSVFGQGDAPPFVKGQSQSTKSVASVIQVPHNQATKKSSSQTLIETGNKNRLINPGFENGVAANTGWSTSLTGTASTSEAAVNPAFAGDKSYEVTCNGNASGGTCTFKQDVPTTFVSQASVSIYLKSSVASEDVKVYSRVNGVNTAQYIPTTNRGTADFSNYEIPVIAGTTSTGIAIEITAPPAGSAVIILDEGFVGYKDVLANTSVIGPWTTFTPTGSWTTNTTYTGKYRQVGQNVEARYRVVTSGAPTAAILTLDMPPGLTIDTASLATTNQYQQRIGEGEVNDVGTDIYPVAATYLSSTSVDVLTNRTSTGTNPVNISNGVRVAQNQPFTWGATDVLVLTINVPVTQFAASTNTLSSTNGNTSWAPCGHTTSDFTGFGTVTNIETQCKRDGDDLVMKGHVTAGTTTAVEGRVNIKFNGGSLTSKALTSQQVIGAYFNGSANAVHGGAVIVQSSTSYINFSSAGVFGSTSVNAYTRANGDVAVTNGGLLIFNNVRIPIAGWENSNVIVANLSGLEKCEDTYACTDTFTAKVSTTGVVTEGGPDWITGNASISATSLFALTWKSGLFTSVPDCQLTPLSSGGSPDIRFEGAVTTTGATAYTLNQTTATAYAFNISCTKTGADLIGKTAKAVASDQNVRSIGSLGVDIQSVTFGSGANCSTACTTGNCTICKQVGTKITTISHTGTAGVLNFNGIDGTKYNCQGAGLAAGVSATVYQNQTTQTSSYARIQTLNPSGASVDAIAVVVTCIGIP